jgi:hypothetical protein
MFRASKQEPARAGTHASIHVENRQIISDLFKPVRSKAQGFQVLFLLSNGLNSHRTMFRDAALVGGILVFICLVLAVWRYVENHDKKRQDE